MQPVGSLAFALDGVREGRFWLLPESAENDTKLRERMDSILERSNPVSAW